MSKDEGKKALLFATLFLILVIPALIATWDHLVCEGRYGIALFFMAWFKELLLLLLMVGFGITFGIKKL